MSAADPQMKIRLPKELRDRVAESARLNNRSLNAEVVGLIEAAFRTQETELRAVSIIETLVDRIGMLEDVLVQVAAKVLDEPAAPPDDG